MNRRALALAVILPVALVSLSIAFLGSPDRGNAAPAELVVFAASSLKEVFEDLAPFFERRRPGTKVRFSFAGSQELRTQLEQGAKADVFAAADLQHMSALETQGLIAPPVAFARNELVIVVPRGNPAGIGAVTELPRTKRLVVGAPEVPIGRYTARVFEAVGRTHGAALQTKIEAAIVSRELNVRQVLAKVVLGEADAGIVYRTDALAAKGKVEEVPIPPGVNVVAEYPMAVSTQSGQPALARAWIELVLGAEGQRRLLAAGFRSVAMAAQSPAR